MCVQVCMRNVCACDVYACTGVYVMRMRADNTSCEKSQENFAEKIFKILLTRFVNFCIMYIVR